MADEATLTYFDGRGRAEIIRIALSFAKIPFKDVAIRNQDDFAKVLKGGNLLFGQVPLLEIDGLKLVQSNAAVRYVADRAGLIPDNSKDRARMDMLYDGTRDFAPHYLLPLGLEGQDDELRKMIITKLQPKYLPIFNKALEENGTGYLVGDSLTMADLGLLEPLLNMEDYLGIEHLEGFPALQDFVKKMKSREEGRTYITKYRTKKNDKQLMNEVKATLPHLFK